MLSAALASGLVLVAVTVLVLTGVTHELDRAALRAVQGPANGAFDLAANVHTILGLPYVTLPLAAAWSLALWRRGHGAASLAPLLIGAAVCVELALKLTTGHAPPGPETSRTVIHFVPAPDTPSSYPSGHATRLTFLAALVALVAARRAVTVAAAGFVVITLLARVYIGDHWPT
ncbi:MAG TPA: phosphatase PAP2 family protein, partial [Candidatus Limnocylindria bacterium]|nr:phosphatase PAP2 family protein [Candidatus Limnocylindria bacterium]